VKIFIKQMKSLANIKILSTLLQNALPFDKIALFSFIGFSPTPSAMFKGTDAPARCS